MVADHIFCVNKSRTPALEERYDNPCLRYIPVGGGSVRVNICLLISKSPAVIGYNSDAPIAKSREESQRTTKTLSYHDDLIKYVSFLFMLRELQVQCNNQLLHRGVRKFCEVFGAIFNKNTQ